MIFLQLTGSEFVSGSLNSLLGRLVIPDLLAVVASRNAFDDRGRRVFGDGLSVTVHENSEHDVGMGGEQRIVLLRLTDALSDAGRGCLWRTQTLNVLVLAVEADDRVLRRNGRAIRANGREIVGRSPRCLPLA